MTILSTTAGDDFQDNSQRFKRRILLIVIPCVAAIVGLVIYLLGGRYISTDDAYIKANKIPISAEVSGTVARVFVNENDDVTAGQSLLQLDTQPFHIAVKMAEAKLAKVRTDLSALKANFYAKQAEIATAHTNLTFALKDQKRQESLLAGNFVAMSTVEDAQRKVQLATDQIHTLQQQLESIKAMLDGSVDRKIEQQPSYLAALAALDQAKLDLHRTTIKASVAGRVGRPPQPGQYVATGHALMALVAINNLWVEANFTETELTHITPGQRVTINLAMYPNDTWQGVVDSISATTGAEMSIIPPQNATGNWVRITQRLPVRIKLLPHDKSMQLLAGLSATVKVDTEHYRRIFGWSLYKTTATQ